MKSRANSHNPTWLPDGGAGRPNGLTEGAWFVEWLQLKVTNVTPFAAIAALPPKGAARKAPLKGELPPQRLRGCGRHPRFYEIPGEFVPAPLAPLLGELSSKARLRGAAGSRSFLKGQANSYQPFFAAAHRTLQKGAGAVALSVSPYRLPAPPMGEPRKPLRIRLGFSEWYPAYRRKPLRRCAPSSALH